MNPKYTFSNFVVGPSNEKDEAKVRELFAPAQSRPVDVEGRRFTVSKERIVLAMLRASGEIKAERVAPTRWRTVFALAAGFAVLVGSAGWFALQRPQGTVASDPSLSITGVRGMVTRVDNAAELTFAAGKIATISPVGELITSPQSEATLRAANGLEIDIFENSRVSLEGLGAASANSVNLGTGYIRCRVPRLAEGHTFSVLTPDASVVVHGTVFRVMVSGRGGETETCVRVDDGIVHVQTAGGEIVVPANQSWGCGLEEQPAISPATSPTRRPVASPASPTATERPAERTRTQLGTLDEENRLFQAGLSAERKGDARGAGVFFERLLSRYPDSPLVPDVRRALARLKPGQQREQ